MLFSWLRWNFSLILELNLPPQNNQHPSRERQNTHSGLQGAPKSSHTTHRHAPSAATPLAARASVICMIVDVGTMEKACCAIYIISKHVSLWVFVSDVHTRAHAFTVVSCVPSVGGCAWEIFTELQSYSAHYVCRSSSRGGRWFYFKKLLLMKLTCWGLQQRCTKY